MARSAESDEEAGPDRTEPSGLVDIARVGQLADAGYLASRLGGEGIDCEVHRQDCFDAVHGSYSPAFFLRVDPQSASAARLVLRQESDSYDSDDQALLGDPLRYATLGWRSLALAALTGAACFWVGQRLADAQHAQRKNSLAEFVAAVDRPFVARGKGGRVDVLSVDPINRLWRIETDLNGDGAAELSCRIPYVP